MVRSKNSVADGLTRLMDKAIAGGYVPPEPPQVVKGVSTLRDASGGVTAEWTKTRAAGMSPGDAVEMPDPKKLVSVSTMTDSQGQVIVQWTKEKAEDAQREQLWEAFAAELARTLPKETPLPPPLECSSDLLAVYPVGDMHVGMRAWARETGDHNYDLDIADRLLSAAGQRLIGSCPSCDQAFIAFLGDFFHYDSYDAVTPANKHLLDADGRYPKMLSMGVRMIRRLIGEALLRHKRVHVVFARGNHDPSTAAAVTVFLEALYENEPRVTIDTTAMAYHYFEFGKVLLGVHHGDKAKMERLPAIMAHDKPEAWGRTRHRLWMTGHVHSEHRKEFPGVKVESFEVLPPLDAYASHAGYRSESGMKAIVFHKDWGEIERHTVRADMFHA